MRFALLTFLIADDNEDDLILLTEAIHSISTGVGIFRASNGQRAVDACSPPSGLRFDLVVLDYYLPGRTAKEILPQLCSLPFSSPLRVVVLSSPLSADERASLLQSGAAAVLDKPGDYDGYRGLARHLPGMAVGSQIELGC
jgi:CheY-like chemotaxis protein